MNTSVIQFVIILKLSSFVISNYSKYYIILYIILFFISKTIKIIFEKDKMYKCLFFFAFIIDLTFYCFYIDQSFPFFSFTVLLPMRSISKQTQKMNGLFALDSEIFFQDNFFLAGYPFKIWLIDSHATMLTELQTIMT